MSRLKSDFPLESSPEIVWAIHEGQCPVCGEGVTETAEYDELGSVEVTCRDGHVARAEISGTDSDWVGYFCENYPTYDRGKELLLKERDFFADTQWRETEDAQTRHATYEVISFEVYDNGDVYIDCVVHDVDGHPYHGFAYRSILRVVDVVERFKSGRYNKEF